MSVELKTAANIKYINVKMKKKLKNNSEIIYIIKDAGEICVKILLFLLCCENLEKIDFEFMKNHVKADSAGDDDILDAVKFWKEKDILEYEITSLSSIKGPNMENIINIILKIDRDINGMRDGDAEDDDAFDEGLGIYSKKYNSGIKEKYAEISPEPVPQAIPQAEIKQGNKEEFEEPEKIDAFEEIDESEDVFEIMEPEKPEIPEIKPPRETPAPRAPGQPVSIQKLIESFETQEEFRRLIHDAQIKMQTTFNTADLEIMYNLYETNNMEVDLILRLAEICVEENTNNIRYLEKVALGMAANGISTSEKFNEMCRMKEEEKIFEDKIRDIFNVGGRKFNSKEKSFIKTWVKEFNFTDDVLTEGYNRCIKHTGKLSLDYINTIYNNWHGKGFKTLDDINGEYGANGNGVNHSGAGNKKIKAFNMDELFEKAVKKRW